MKRSTLAAYIPNRLIALQAPSFEEGPIEILYRARVLPYWLGELAQEKKKCGLILSVLRNLSDDQYTLLAFIFVTGANNFSRCWLVACSNERPVS